MDCHIGCTRMIKEKSLNGSRQNHASALIHNVTNHDTQNRHSSVLKGNQTAIIGKSGNNRESQVDDEYNETIEYLMLEHNDSTKTKDECGKDTKS